MTEHYEAGGYASGYGVQVEAGIEGTSVTTADGTTTSDWDVSGDVSGGVTEFASALASADNVEASVDDMFSDLG